MVRKNWPEVTPPVRNDDHRIYVCTPMLMFDWIGGGHHQKNPTKGLPAGVKSYIF